MSKTTPQDAYRLARRWYLSGRKFDLGHMANELGVNRVTLYRWVGTKERFLVDTTWDLTRLTLEQQWQRHEHHRGARVPLVLTGFAEDMLAWPEVRRFNAENNAFLMNVMTTAEHGFHARFVTHVQHYVQDDVDTGRTAGAVPVADLAFASVRLVESYMYLPTIDRRDPDLVALGRVLTALLRP